MAADTFSLSSFLAAVADVGPLLDGIFKTPVVSEIFTVLNMAILALGTVWLTYNILAATVQSAWDGKFLGKRFHSVWMPIRLFIGFAALLPMFDGWGAAQVVLYQTAKMGAGVANIAVSGVVSKMTKPEVQSVASHTGSSLAGQMFNTLLCRARVGILAQQSAELEAAGGGGNTDWANYYGIERCGGAPTVPTGDLQSAHTTATQAMIASLTPVATRVAAGQEGRGPAVPSSEVAAAIKSAADAYDSAIDQAARDLANSKAVSLQATQNSKGSWLTYGYLSVAAAKAQRDVIGAAAAGPNLSANTNTTQGGIEAANYTGSMMEAEGMFGAQAAGASAGDSYWSQFKKLKDNPGLFINILFSDAKSAKLTPGGDLIQGLASFGATLITIAVIAIGVLFAAFVVLAFTSFLGAGAIPLARFVSNLAMAIILPLIVMGITLSVYVPMLPALFWTFGVIGWLLVVAECLCLAPIWALVHLEAEGEGMGQRAEHGYVMLVDLLLRPLVLVFAFTVASSVLNVVWMLFSHGLAGALEIADANSLTKFFMWVGAAFVLVAFAVQFIVLVYKLALEIQNQLVVWLGKSAANYIGDHTAKDPNDSLRGARLPQGAPGRPQGGGDKPAPAPAPSAPAGGA